MTNSKDKSSSSLVADNQQLSKKEPEGKSLSGFITTIMDVLEDITTLEVNTIIVQRIPLVEFDAQDFYVEIMDKINYETEGGLKRTKEGLERTNEDLKKRESELREGLSLPQVPQDESVSITSKEAEKHLDLGNLIAKYNNDVESYHKDLASYNQAQDDFDKHKKTLDKQEEKEQFDIVQGCYNDIWRQLSKLKIEKDDDELPILDGRMVRYFRKLWEIEQSLINGDRIYAQTKFGLDGDLTNRFINDLFMPSRTSNDPQAIDPKTIPMVFELHNKALENAQKQWSGLIDTCVRLVTNLIPK